MGLERIDLNDCIYRNLLTIRLIKNYTMRDGLWGATGLLFRFRIHCLFRHRHALAFEEYKELGAPVYKAGQRLGSRLAHKGRSPRHQFITT
jgi:hypothetical protein